MVVGARRKHHIAAALSIIFVRGILINIGGFMVFNYLVNHTVNLPLDVKILAAFIIVFSIVISWFKDLPDLEGDAQYKIKTLAIVYSPKSVFLLGTTILALTYLATIFLKYASINNVVSPSNKDLILLYGHIFFLILFVVNSLLIDLKNHGSIKNFYKRFWFFFFAEYLLYLIAYLYK